MVIRMRKFQKNQILDIMENIHTIHLRVKEKLGQKEYDTVQTALSDCQEAAIQLGEAIEQIAGEGTDVVSYLERYCERVYQISVERETVLPQKAYKSLEENLIKAENALKSMATEKVAVFLPYKASMWDSLESVWRAADADSEWTSLVMPIPYFTKNKDGSPGEMQYEGADFPPYVPIVDWQQYALEGLQPDVIFIHNPYDQYNLVTTVHPYFYASKIRKYTDKLVYIPYFVHKNEVVLEQYCILPGTLYADLVILQSEKVREHYIQYYSAVLPELVEKLGKQAIEQKFQALGSPKLDRTDINETVIPDEWTPFLDKNKKILFFNTHLSGVMKGKSEQFLKKLDDIFSYFKRRSDVVLLWRPHPLTLDTAVSMNPEAAEPYMQLVNRYREENIGIYDDSKDLHRAVNLSDAYYGDTSSVVELFRRQGKPILIMDHAICNS